MARLKYSDYPPNLTEAEESYLIDNLRDYGLSVGFCVKRNSPETGYCAALAPITLFPSLFPRKCFEMAENVQQPYNTLYAKIASDTQWLEKAIAE
jgi:glutathione synthase